MQFFEFEAFKELQFECYFKMFSVTLSFYIFNCGISINLFFQLKKVRK